MPFNTVAQLEAELLTRGYKLSRKYDEVKGICTATAVSNRGDEVLTSANRSRMGYWAAYKKALEFILSEVIAFDSTESRVKK